MYRAGTVRVAENRAGRVGKAGPWASASELVRQAPTDAFNSWPPFVTL